MVCRFCDLPRLAAFAAGGWRTAIPIQKTFLTEAATFFIKPLHRAIAFRLSDIACCVG
jgi:hypothetical protein